MVKEIAMKTNRITGITALILVLGFVLFCGGNVLAAEHVFTYTIVDETVIIGAYHSENAVITIPASIDGKPVVAIAPGAFADCPNLCQVEVPSTVTDIPEDVFPGREGFFVTGEEWAYIASYCAKEGIDFQAVSLSQDQVTESDGGMAASDIVFSDVAVGAWYYTYVYDLANKNVVHGITATIFAPNASVTRAEFVMMLSNLWGLTEAEREAYGQMEVFSDVVSSRWYAPCVNWAGAEGIVLGVGNGRFDPDAPISRQEMMTMLLRYQDFASDEALPVLASEVRFLDDADIATWAKSAVKSSQMAGIIQGKEKFLFDPLGISTRAEAAKIISILSDLPEGGGDSGIRGLVFGIGETVYWQDGNRIEGVVAPVTVNGHSCISGEIYAAAMGYNVEKADDGASLTISVGEDWLILRNGNDQAETAGGEGLTLPVAPFLSDTGTLLIPIAAVAGYFNDQVIWNEDNQALVICDGDREIGDLAPWLIGLIWEKDSRSLSEKSVHVETGVYGQSGKGRNLTYTSIYQADFTKTIVLVFEQHGFEDEYDRDGQVLVDTANGLIEKLTQGAVDLGGCRLVIVSSANPDGLAEGYTNNGPGRCTIVGTVDMNRDWPTSNYIPNSTARYYSMSPLSCNETLNLKNLIIAMDPTVLIDFHGWLNGTYGDSQLADIFYSEMSLPLKTLFSQSQGLEANNTTYLTADEIVESYAVGLIGFSGYLAGWGKEQGYRSALVEFASPNQADVNKLTNAIEEVIRSAS